jgi:hypothetical protein
MKEKYLAEPVFKVGTVQAVIALFIALKFNLSASVTGIIEGGAAAAGGLFTAFVVEEGAPALFTGLLTAAGTLLVAFGVPNVSSELVSAVYALLAIVMASLLRGQVHPKPIGPAKVELLRRRDLTKSPPSHPTEQSPPAAQSVPPQASADKQVGTAP